MEKGDENPNQKLTPYYDGETLKWVTVVEYYALLARVAWQRIEIDNGEESHTS